MADPGYLDHTMAEFSDIQEMLDAYRFDDAERLIEAGGDIDLQLREEVGRRRTEAEERGRDLSQHIVRLANDRRQAEIAELTHDPSTRRLLDLLNDGPSERAEKHLKEAERWEEARRRTNTRRLQDARRAFDDFDLDLARGLMNKIDGRFLSGDQVEERDRMLLEISARAMEMESIVEAGQQLIEETEPKPGSQRRPWWHRWFG